MQLFYTPDIASDASFYTLSEVESRHCIRVLRLAPGDQVELVDGKGNLFTALLKDANPKRTSLQIIAIRKDFARRNHYLHIAVAPTKNIDRLEWFLEKATEIGIDEVSLLLCQRSERKEAKAERLNRVITAAMKQSLKAWHPVLNELQPLESLLRAPFSGQKFIAHCEAGDRRGLKELLIPHGRYLILVGPEGDFSPEEIGKATRNEFKAITLGESRLRTETAALEACFEVNFLNR